MDIYHTSKGNLSLKILSLTVLLSFLFTNTNILACENLRPVRDAAHLKIGADDEAQAGATGKSGPEHPALPLTVAEDYGIGAECLDALTDAERAVAERILSEKGIRMAINRGHVVTILLSCAEAEEGSLKYDSEFSKIIEFFNAWTDAGSKEICQALLTDEICRKLISAKIKDRSGQAYAEKMAGRAGALFAKIAAELDLRQEVEGFEERYRQLEFRSHVRENAKAFLREAGRIDSYMPTRHALFSIAAYVSSPEGRYGAVEQAVFLATQYNREEYHDERFREAFVEELAAFMTYRNRSDHGRPEAENVRRMLAALDETRYVGGSDLCREFDDRCNLYMRQPVGGHRVIDHFKYQFCHGLEKSHFRHSTEAVTLFETAELTTKEKLAAIEDIHRDLTKRGCFEELEGFMRDLALIIKAIPQAKEADFRRQADKLVNSFLAVSPFAFDRSRSAIAGAIIDDLESGRLRRAVLEELIMRSAVDEARIGKEELSRRLGAVDEVMDLESRRARLRHSEAEAADAVPSLREEYSAMLSEMDGAERFCLLVQREFRQKGGRADLEGLFAGAGLPYADKMEGLRRFGDSEVILSNPGYRRIIEDAADKIEENYQAALKKIHDSYSDGTLLEVTCVSGAGEGGVVSVRFGGIVSAVMLVEPQDEAELLEKTAGTDKAVPAAAIYCRPSSPGEDLAGGDGDIIFSYMPERLQRLADIQERIDAGETMHVAGIKQTAAVIDGNAAEGAMVRMPSGDTGFLKQPEGVDFTQIRGKSVKARPLDVMMGLRGESVAVLEPVSGLHDPWIEFEEAHRQGSLVTARVKGFARNKEGNIAGLRIMDETGAIEAVRQLLPLPICGSRRL